MIRCLLVMALILTSGCATRPPSARNAGQFCSPEWYGPVRFVDDGAGFAPVFENTLALATRPSATCEVRSVQVVGLSAPGSEGLAGRRSAAVRDALTALGLPTAIFSLGDVRSQQHPFIVIEATGR